MKELGQSDFKVLSKLVKSFVVLIWDTGENYGNQDGVISALVL